MSVGDVDAQEPARIVEWACRALWVVESAPVFASCRCNACGGLRDTPPSLHCGQDPVDHDGVWLGAQARVVV
jgi:hypothetical protein